MVELAMKECQLSFSRATRAVVDELVEEAFEKGTSEDQHHEMVCQVFYLAERLYRKEPEACAELFPYVYEQNRACEREMN
jgi:hypothetical protein